MKKTSLWQRWLRQPQQLYLRRAALQVHLWAGLLLSLYVIAIGVSGSVVVFKDDWSPRPTFHGPAPDPNTCAPAQLLAAIEGAERGRPGAHAVLASCPTAANPFFAVRVEPSLCMGKAAGMNLTTFVHPVTLRVSGDIDQDASWMGVIDRFHTELLLGESGRRWNGYGALVLLLLVGTGVVLWWPGITRWRRAFTVSLRSNWKRLNFDLHSAIGIWTVLFTLTWAVTSIYFAWETPIEGLIASIAPITTARYPAAELAAAAQRPMFPVRTSFNLADVLWEAAERSPKAHLAGVYFGSGPKPILTVYMARGETGDYARTDFLYFDQRSGQFLMAWRRGQNHTLGDWVLWLLVPLHFGTSFGMVGKVVWAVAGLSLPLLTITGWVLYWNRSLARWLRYKGRVS